MGAISPIRLFENYFWANISPIFAYAGQGLSMSERANRSLVDLSLARSWRVGRFRRVHRL